MEDKILKAVFIIVGSVIITRLLPRLIRFPHQHSAKAKTILDYVRQSISFVVYFLAALALLSLYGIDMTPYLVSSSIVGFAIGFGAQNFIKDIIAGIYLLLEPEFKIGRFIEIGTHKGILKKISLKTTYLESEDNKTIFIIPNGEVKTIIINRNPQ